MKYTADQKNKILVFSGLASRPLMNTEMKALFEEVSQSDLDAFLKDPIQETNIPEGWKERMNELISQSARLSSQLYRLENRGISFWFDLESLPKAAREIMSGKEQLLFMLGNSALLSEGGIPVVSSLAQLAQTPGKAILFVEDGIDPLLHFEAVNVKLKRGNLLAFSPRFQPSPEQLICHSQVHNQRSQTMQNIESKSLEGKSMEHNLQNPKPAVRRKVFISGSRSQEAIPKNIQESLEKICKLGIEVMLGDSSKGVDGQIADYLREPLYPYVSIYTVLPKPRIEVEDGWKLQIIEVHDPKLTLQKKQMEKDRIMAAEANFGLAVFNPISVNRYGNLQVSSGTLRNTIQMLLEKKSVKFFYLYEGEMKLADLHHQNGLSALEEVLNRYKEEEFDPEDTDFTKVTVPKDMTLSELRHQKIMKKYEELKKGEIKLREALKAEKKPEKSAYETLTLGI
ncbi:hypothetical protein AAK899_03015 [Erysipelotrichaceae bacterium 51-3]